ncbi:MAG: extracellular solute-binding protein, partial [Candidatus Thermoplasmatota archaeon]|nr:extracellular solute-binding protein [Candidatus Thermoplasmatota archaeon]
LLSAAQQLTFGEQVGISIPTKDPYRWFALNSGYGGQLFDSNGQPTLNSNGSAEALKFWLDFELEHEIVPTGTNIETMKTHFIEGRAAMIIDGPWQWPTYEKAKMDLGQSLLPIVSETGLRMSPMVGFKGWSVSKQSPNKEAAVSLALFLSSEQVQKEAAEDTRTMPVSESLYSDNELLDDTVLAGFIEQAKHGFPAPTSRAMTKIYSHLPSAIENAYLETKTPSQALSDANAALIEELES